MNAVTAASLRPCSSSRPVASATLVRRGGHGAPRRDRVDRFGRPTTACASEPASRPGARDRAAVGRRQRRRARRRRGVDLWLVGTVGGAVALWVVAGPGVATLFVAVARRRSGGRARRGTSAERRRQVGRRTARRARRDRPLACVPALRSSRPSKTRRGDRGRDRRRPRRAWSPCIGPACRSPRRSRDWRSTRPLPGVRLTASALELGLSARRRARSRRRRRRGDPARQPRDLRRGARAGRAGTGLGPRHRSRAARLHRARVPGRPPHRDRSSSRRRPVSTCLAVGLTLDALGAAWMARITRTTRVMPWVLGCGMGAARARRRPHWASAARARLGCASSHRRRGDGGRPPTEARAGARPRHPLTTWAAATIRPPTAASAVSVLVAVGSSPFVPLLAPAAGAARLAVRMVARAAQRRATSDRIRRGLPEVVDLFVVGIGAGLNVPLALRAIGPLCPTPVRRRAAARRGTDRDGCPHCRRARVVAEPARRAGAPTVERAHRVRALRRAAHGLARAPRRRGASRSPPSRRGRGTARAGQAPLPLGVLQPARPRAPERRAPHRRRAAGPSYLDGEAMHLPITRR